jgi:hypothetical protein
MKMNPKGFEKSVFLGLVALDSDPNGTVERKLYV